jgi:hypothetical protein
MMTTGDIIKVLPQYVQALAVVTAGGWAYWKFIYQRQKDPASDIDLDLRFVGIQDQKWIIEVTAFLENKSLVQHRYENFTVSIRYLLTADSIEDGDEKILYQLKCPRTINDRIGGNQCRFGNVDFLNPRQVFKHRYITFVPASASFVWVQCRFFFRIGSRVEKINSQKIFRVPSSDNAPQTLSTAALRHQS